MRRAAKRADPEFRAKEARRRSEYRQRFKELERERDREYKRKNRKRIRDAARAYYQANKEMLRARYAGYRLKNLEKQRERQRLVKAKWRTSPAAKLYRKAYYAANSIRMSLRCRMYGALRAYSKGGKSKKTAEYGIDIEAIAKKLGACPGPRKDWHIDHIRPLSSFDFNDPEQIRVAFSAANHQWLPARENLIKNARYAKS